MCKDHSSTAISLPVDRPHRHRSTKSLCVWDMSMKLDYEIWPTIRVCPLHLYINRKKTLEPFWSHANYSAYPSPISEASNMMYCSHRLPTTLPHEKHLTGIIWFTDHGHSRHECCSRIPVNFIRLTIVKPLARMGLGFTSKVEWSKCCSTESEWGWIPSNYGTRTCSQQNWPMSAHARWCMMYGQVDVVDVRAAEHTWYERLCKPGSGMTSSDRNGFK